jgi:hypothetical protein
MAAYAPASKPANIINHVTVIADESSSMSGLAATLVKVFGNLVAHLAAQSRANGQETRITVYFFNSYGTSRCVIYDMDVLRAPSIEGFYSPRGMTALIDTVMLSVEDMRMIPQKYGDHSFLTLVLTDGQENHSQKFSSFELSHTIASAPENETYGVFVPNQMGVHEAKQHGFPAANISVWDATSAQGMEEVGRVMRDVSDAYMEGRAHGVRGYSARSSAGGSGLFRMKDFSAADVTHALTPITPGSFFYLDVTQNHRDPGSDGARLDHFYEAETGKPYPKGRCYYEFTKTEKVQGYKQVAIEVGGVLYSGTLDETRGLLGLPADHEVKLRPDQKPGATIFIQSTSNNRKLMPGTRLLVLR